MRECMRVCVCWCVCVCVCASVRESSNAIHFKRMCDLCMMIIYGRDRVRVIGGRAIV